MHFIIVMIRWTGLAPWEFEYVHAQVIRVVEHQIKRHRHAAVEIEKLMGPFKVRLLHRNVQRFRGGLVFKAHRLVYHSTLGLRVIKKIKRHRHAAVEIEKLKGPFKVSAASSSLYTSLSALNTSPPALPHLRVPD